RSHARGKALFGAGFLSWKQGELDDAARYATEALTIFRENGDALWTGYAELCLAIVLVAQRRTSESRPLLIDCLRIFKEMNATWDSWALTLKWVASQKKRVATRKTECASTRIFTTRCMAQLPLRRSWL